MKTISDLEKMKAQPCFPFDSAYSFFIVRLADYYISKSDGIDRIRHELEEWDEPAKEFIMNLILDEIKDFDTVFLEDDYDLE